MKTSTDITEKLKELAAMLSDDAVKTSADVLQDELPSRAAVSTSELVAYKHDCHKYYKYHRDSPKRYSMLVTSVDTQKTDEQAFCGKYLGFSGEHMIPKNSVVIEVCNSTYTAYRVVGDYAKEELDTRFRGSLHRLIRSAAKAIQKQ